MAIVTGPALSIDASGNLGSMCYSKWRGLQIARKAKSYEPTHTQKQVDQWNRAVAAAQAWSGILTDDERLAWRRAAVNQTSVSRLGTTYIPSGYQYFLGLTIQLFRQDYTLRRMPPTATEPFMHLAVEAVQVTGYPDKLRTYFIDRSPAYPTEIQGEDWMAGPFKNNGYHPQRNDYRFTFFRTITGGKLYSGLVPDKYYWFRMRWIDVFGRVGNWFETSILLTF